MVKAVGQKPEDLGSSPRLGIKPQDYPIATVGPFEYGPSPFVLCSAAS